MRLSLKLWVHWLNATVSTRTQQKSKDNPQVDAFTLDKPMLTNETFITLKVTACKLQLKGYIQMTMQA
jgi:hypothetical protein